MADNQYKISPALYNITQRQIALLDQENANGEGWNYYCNGQVVHANVFKNEISGIIRDYLEEFKVQVKVNKHEIFCSCTCESENVVCKHVLALLYSWVYDQEEFINVGSFINRLKDLEHDQLIKVMERFLADDPQNIKFFEKQRDLELEIDNLTFD